MKKAVFLLLLYSLSACRVRFFKKIDKNTVYHIDTVNNNVCKKLKDDVVLYAIFVDSKYTGYWTQFDIESTLDSIQKAMNWIEKQAAKEGVNLHISIAYHQNKKTIPIKGQLSRRSLYQTLFSNFGKKNVDKWADKIAKTALTAYKPDTSSVIKTKITPKNRENLLARLRDIYKTDNVALMYFINNFYSNEISVVLHAGSDDSPEYGIVSYKFPGIIAHEFLHLFGALDLYVSPFDKKRKFKKRKAFAMKEFPNEIMAFPHRRINTLTISTFTKYLIGWQHTLEPRYKDMLIGKKIKIAHY
jgi:hypothetical protein